MLMLRKYFIIKYICKFKIWDSDMINFIPHKHEGGGVNFSFLKSIGGQNGRGAYDVKITTRWKKIYKVKMDDANP